MDTIPDTLDALRVPVESLSFYGRNPRTGDVDAIVESLRANGQYRPLVVNRRTGEVLAGNHTLKAAKRLGWAEIAATYVDVDADQAARIVLVDNRTNDLAAYDDDALAELLADLPTLEGTGFDGEALAELLRSVTDQPAAGNVPDEDAPPGGTGYREQYAVIVVCTDEVQQAKVYDELMLKGYACRVVST